MAPATLSGTLPKSNRHQSIALALVGDPVSVVPSLVSPVQDGDHRDNDDGVVDPAFSFPGYVISPPSFDGIVNLVVVCCHAIFHPSPSIVDFPLYSPHEERNWHLAPFQQSDPKTGKPGEHETFLAHLSAGIDTLTTGPWAGNSLLVFSGGATKRNLTTVSEARSYYHAALAQRLAQGHKHGGFVRTLFEKNRLLLEEQATDSFQNLLFSILLFRQTTGIYPHQVRVITHAFKAKRFLELHAPALRWPLERIRVCGIDPVMSAAEYEDTVKGEGIYGYAPWVKDALGTGEVLDKKRRQRGWNEDALVHLSEGLENSVRRLLCGEHVDVLPWSTAAGGPENHAT